MLRAQALHSPEHDAWQFAEVMERQFAESIPVAAIVDVVFDHLDDHRSLASHMEQGSMMMMGSSMKTTTGEGGGRHVGSHIFMDGRMLGLKLSLDEVVDQHERPLRKAWHTIGEPQLIVIGGYRMGFELTPAPSGSMLKVFIEYDLPRGVFGRLLGWMFGGVYARWCVRSMLKDAAKYFATHAAPETQPA
jgi:hypothetical protein